VGKGLGLLDEGKGEKTPAAPHGKKKDSCLWLSMEGEKLETDQEKGWIIRKTSRKSSNCIHAGVSREKTFARGKKGRS